MMKSSLATKYSTLTDINRETVAHLAEAWEWSPGEKALRRYRSVVSGGSQ
jgi:glucose dehydrogenase